jgi:hypothetical protein
MTFNICRSERETEGGRNELNLKKAHSHDGNVDDDEMK